MQITAENITLALEAAETQHTVRCYRRGLESLRVWLEGRTLTYAELMAYRGHLVMMEQSPQNVNQQLAAVRFFLHEMANRGMIEPDAAEGIGGVKNLKVKGRKLGNWLSIERAEAFINAPDLSSPIGLRDRAILGLMIGAGLRRSEVCALEPRHFERRPVENGQERWLIVGIKGKHGRTRNIPIADWIKGLVDAWTMRARIGSGPIIRAARWSAKKERLTLSDAPITPAAVFFIVKKYGALLAASSVAPHDMRRTFARLAHEGGVDMKQIQLALGHANQATTEAYVNAQQNMSIAPSDMLGLNVEV